ncbi:MAG: hypothetical protein COB67_02065 [SAR324 cluster bacterium]|uniref:Folylpolyglutamate synthetase n=1 Tax=SAR324 cluster bacterium TaxID=2024889 RepID=A0A2A4T9S1_9DELT|nr:MAG: hypothetical protein COB67_02065 [SAR324 cluster bacterium]
MTPEHLDALYTLGISNIKLGLSNIRQILDAMGNPQRHPQIIHFAGTNGKGSTLVTLETLLLQSGYSVGSTVSPHLISFNERFRINGISVEDASLDEAFFAVCRACGIDASDFRETAQKSRIRPTFFEFAIAMAFFLFRKYQVEYILLETGLGGRLDATNVVEDPLACVLTRIDFDHQEFLGNSLPEITGEKLGILKGKTPVFVAYQREEVTKQILEVCYEQGAPCLLANREFGFRDQEESLTLYLRSEDQAEPEGGINHQLKTNSLGLLGDHQKENITTALALYWSLVPAANLLDQEQLRSCLQGLHWPARLQYLNEDKSLLIDGAHNASGMKSLLEFLNKAHKDQKILFAVSWLEHKEFLAVFEQLNPQSVSFQPLEMKMDKAKDISQIYQLLQKQGFLVAPPMTVLEFTEQLDQDSLPERDLLVVAGSLYLIGEFLSYRPS